MTTTYTQTDTSATFNVGCSGQTAGGTTVGRQMSVGGTAGTVEAGFDPNNNVTRACFVFDAGSGGEPGLASWDAGTWNININHTTMDAGTNLSRIDVCDYNGSTFTTVASNTSPGHTAGDTTKTDFTVTQGSAHTPQSQANSRPFIVLTYTNADPHGGSNGGITPGLTVVAPYTLSTPPISAAVTDGSKLGDTMLAMKTVHAAMQEGIKQGDTETAALGSVLQIFHQHYMKMRKR